MADRFDLRCDIQLNTRVLSAVYKTRRPAVGPWTPTKATGSRPFCVMASGNLSTPRVPDFRGLDRFQGKWYHSGLWPHESVDFLRPACGGDRHRFFPACRIDSTNRRPGRPSQRCSDGPLNFSLPARNAALDPNKATAPQGTLRGTPKLRGTRHAVRHRRPSRPRPNTALEATEAEGVSVLMKRSGRREEASASFIPTLTCWVNKEANDTASEFVRQKFAASSTIPAERRRSWRRRIHPIGTKNMSLDTDYYKNPIATMLLWWT